MMTWRKVEHVPSKLRRMVWRNIGSGEIVVGSLASSGKEDRRLIIEHGLLMGGIESNPGPWEEMTFKRIQYLTMEDLKWTFDTAKRIADVNTFSSRVKRLLKHYEPRPSTYRIILETSARVEAEATADPSVDAMSHHRVM